MELADMQDLGSCARACRFDPCYPHQNRIAVLAKLQSCFFTKKQASLNLMEYFLFGRGRDMKCPVCGNNTFSDTDYEYDICKECFWEYDLVQVDNPNLPGGANNHSLNEYRKIYQGLLENNPHFSCKNEADRKLIIALDNED